MKQRAVDKMLNQKAVYWANPVDDGYGGFSYDDPIELKARWVDRQEKFINDDAEEVLSTAIILVNKDVVAKGMIALVALCDLNSSELPADEDAWEIRQFQKRPDFKATTFVRKVMI